MYAEINPELEKKYVITDYPLNIGIEVTNYCNLNCIMCNNDKIKRPRGIMSAEMYKKIIDETARENPHTRIWLDFYGEALIAGWKLFWMIDYAKKSGLTNVCINTNGTLMNKEYADMLLDAGTDYISLDCDGFSKEVYEAIRINGNRDVFYSNVEYLLEEAARRGSKTVIDVKVIEMEKNRHEVKKIVDYWQKRGAWVAVRRCSEWVGNRRGNANNVAEGRIACGHGVGTAVISWDGIVGGCAWDYDCSMPAGDIKAESLKAIWMRRNENFLRLHFEHRWDELPEICRSCNNWRNIGEERYDANGVPVERKYGAKETMYKK